MRRVLVLINGVVDTSGGNLRAAINIAEALAGAGEDVTLSAPIVASQPHRTIDAMDARVQRRLFRASRPVARFGGSARQFWWLLRHARDFDEVQTHSIFTLSAVYSIVICAARGVPVILWPHGSIDPFDLRKHARIKNIIGPLVLRRLIDRCAAVVFTTAHERDVAVTFGSSTPRAIVPLPVEPLPASRIDPQQWRHRFGVPTDVPVILFLGRIDYKKRLPLLVESVALMENRQAHLVVVGDGPDSEKRLLADTTERFSIGDRVHVTGWVEGGDRAAAFEIASAFALLSDAENFGLSVIEAMSMGCPTVISDQLALAEHLAAANAAIVVERDASEAAQALDRLLSDRDSAAQLGERAKALVEREYSPRAVAARLREVSAGV